MGRDTSAVARKYAGALAATGLAVLVRWLLDPWLGDHLPLTTLYAAVVLAVWYGGYRPAVVAAVLGYLACSWLFIPPRGALGLDDTRNLVGLALYAMSCSVIIFFGEAMRTARRHADARQDRTEQAERAAKEAALYSENIVATVREPLLVLDGDLRVRTANRSFYRTFGVSPEKTEGCLLYDLGNGQWNVPPLRSLLAEVLPQNTTVEGFEVAHHFPSIGHRIMRINARRIQGSSGETVLILLAIEDVTERRRAEQERREIETRFTSLVKNIKDHAIFTLDTEGRVTSWNVEAERILGYREAEVLGRHFSFIFTAEDVEHGLPEHELRTAKERGRAEDERWHVRKGGERLWALGIITPTHDAEGRHTGYSKILRDMTDRKQAEAALRASEERHRAVVSITTDILWRTDAAGDFVEPQESWEKYTGQPWEQHRGSAWVNAVHPDDRERVAAIWRRACEARSFYEVRCRMWHGPTQSWRHIIGRAVPLLNADGSVREWVGCDQDVHDQKIADEALRQATEQLRIVADSMAAPVTRCSRDLRYLWVSKPYADWINLPASEVVGRPIIDIIGPVAFEQLHARFHEVLSGKVVRYEEQIEFQGIGPRWISAVYTPTLGADGTPDGWVAVVTDVTDRRRMEESLRQGEARFRRLAEAMPQIVWTAAPGGRITYINAQWTALTGLSLEQTNDQDAVTAVIHPDDFGPVVQRWEEALAAGTVHEAQWRFRDQADGSYRWFLTRTVPVRDDAGAVCEWFGTATDIDDQKRAEEALRKREREIRALADNTPALVARFDRDLRHVFVNRQVEAATGLPASAYIGKTNRELGAPEELYAAGDERLRSVFQTGQAATLEFIYPSPAGPRHFHSWFGPEVGPGGEVESALCITRDVTEQ
jgi:PAS domain S-box-containing protein